LLIFIQLLLLLFFRPRVFREGLPLWGKMLHGGLYILIYTSLIATIVSGYFQIAFGPTPISFWGVLLPEWGAADAALADFSRAAHGVGSYVLLASILAHIGVAGINMLRRPRTETPPAAVELETGRNVVLIEQNTGAASKTAQNTQVISKIAQGLARNMRLLGWIQFWAQLLLVFVSAMLLAFATSGRAFSPSESGFGDAIYWGNYGFLLLCFAVLLAFYYTKAAGNMVLRPAFFFAPKRPRGFWFLRLGLAIGLLGVFISFIGVGLSLSLLVAKTVSQPPGIAITDPNKIIRALDVFVLLVNFILLVGHFIGSGATLLLDIQASKARRKYAAMRISLD
jgi:hypothetical protein